LQSAWQLGFKSVIVLGHEHYYPKFSFLPAENLNIKAPFNVHSNVFMAIELMKGGLENVSGIVEYPKEFLTV
jgi:predicted N-acetyltransferase YhbS